jgi:quercetin dioxygenase-like cupin family protein
MILGGGPRWRHGCFSQSSQSWTVRVVLVADRALLLVGFAGTFRRSELAALDVPDLQFTGDGLVITLRRSKGWPERRGAAGRHDIFYYRRESCRPIRRRLSCGDHVGMTNRRDALASALALLCGAGALNAQNQAPSASDGPVFKEDLPNVNLDGWEVTVSEVDMPPGRVGQAHRHFGFVLAYVLEGEIRTKISDQPETTYRAWQMFYEWPGSTHVVSANASKNQPAKLLAMIFVSDGPDRVLAVADILNGDAAREHKAVCTGRSLQFC